MTRREGMRERWFCMQTLRLLCQDGDAARSDGTWCKEDFQETNR
jgi:hypothetical protein